MPYGRIWYNSSDLSTFCTVCATNHNFVTVRAIIALPQHGMAFRCRGLLKEMNDGQQLWRSLDFDSRRPHL